MHDFRIILDAPLNFLAQVDILIGPKIMSLAFIDPILGPCSYIELKLIGSCWLICVYNQTGWIIFFQILRSLVSTYYYFLL